MIILQGMKIIIDYKRTMKSLPAEDNTEYRSIMSQVNTM